MRQARNANQHVFERGRQRPIALNREIAARTSARATSCGRVRWNGANFEKDSICVPLASACRANSSDRSSTSTGAHTAEITWTAAWEQPLLASAIEATIAFASGTVASVFKLCGVTITLDAQTPRYDTLPILMQPVVTAGGLCGGGCACDKGDADSCRGGEGENGLFQEALCLGMRRQHFFDATSTIRIANAGLVQVVRSLLGRLLFQRGKEDLFE